MIVVDAMILTYALIRVPDQTHAVNELLDKDRAWAAPPLWRSELRNVLLQYLRVEEGGRPGQAVTLDDARRKMNLAESLIAGRTFEVDSNSVLETAATTEISAYDGEYVALAKEMNVPLVTMDAEILRAVPNVAVRPEDVAGSED